MNDSLPKMLALCQFLGSWEVLGRKSALVALLHPHPNHPHIPDRQKQRRPLLAVRIQNSESFELLLASIQSLPGSELLNCNAVQCSEIHFTVNRNNKSTSRFNAMQVRIPTGFRQFLRQLPNGEESYWEEGRRQKNGKRFGSFGERESQDKVETEIIGILAFFCRKYISWVQIMPHGCF